MRSRKKAKGEGGGTGTSHAIKKVLIFWILWLGAAWGDEVHELGPYEVTGWRMGEALGGVGGSGVRIGREAIEAAAVGQLSDMLRLEGNVLFRGVGGGGGAGQVSLRGFGENSGLRVLVLVDGVKVNRSDMGGVDWSGLALEELASVEVVRGGQGVLYGQHALAGVIRIETRKGQGVGQRVSGALGNYGRERFSVSAGGRRGEWHGRLGYNWREGGGWRENSGSRGWTGSGSVGWGAGGADELVLRVEFGESRRRYGGPLTHEQFEEDPRQSGAGGEDSGTRTDRGQVSGRWHGVRDWGQVEVHGGWREQEMEWDLDGTHALNDQWTGNWSPRVKWGRGERVVLAGLDMRRDELVFEDYLDEEKVVRQAEADLGRWTFGGYLFGRTSLGARVELSGGVRYERAETDYRYDRFDPTQINPYDPVIWDPWRENPNYREDPEIVEEASYDERLGKDGWAAEVSLTGELGEGIEWWAGYDRVYRYPVLDEVGTYQGYALDEPLNRELEPETGDQVEAGIRWRDGGWDVSATVYRLAMENEIIFDEAANLNVNFGRTLREGVELAVSWRGEAVGGSARWSVTRARMREGAFAGGRLPLVPDQHGVVSGWWAPVESVRLGADVQVTGGQVQGNDYANRFRRVGGYGLVGLEARWVVKEWISLLVRVDNLFEKTYLLSVYNGGYYPDGGRRVEGQVSLEF